MTHCLAENVGFRDLCHRYSRLNAHGHALSFEAILHGEGVDYRGEHTHMVGGGAVHFAVRLSAAPEVAASDNDAHFHAEVLDFDYLVAHRREFGVVDTRPVRRGECFTGKFDDNALVFRCFHI